jgi:DNA ligase-1
MEKKTLYGVDKTGGVKQWSVWTEDSIIFVSHGKLDGKLQTKTTTCKPKNVGRSNETTPEQQASLEAQSKWNKQLDKYYRETIEEAEELLTEGVMLAQDYSKKPHLLEEEFYVSPKLDGLRVKTTFVLGEPVWNSRGGKTYPVPSHLITELKALNEAGYAVLDGEAYIHQVKLQKIQSCVKKANELTPRVTYQIFDIPALSFTWNDRLAMLNSMSTTISQDREKYTSVAVVDQMKCYKENLDDILGEYLSLGFEGVMMRNLGGEYLFQNKRSNDLLKYKIMFDSECRVISCVEDKNKLGLFTVEWTNPDGGVTVQFALSMNGTQEENGYEKLSQRIGDWITFKYQDLTEDGVPTFARGLYFRECDVSGNPIE